MIRTELDRLRQRHLSLASEVLDDTRCLIFEEELDGQLAALGTLAQALAVLRDLSPRLSDGILAVGELISSRLVAGALENSGLPARFVDARHVLVTDNEAPAQPLMEETASRAREHLVPVLAHQRIPVLGGFVGATQTGVTTTLGRGGSDYSASIFGAVLEAREIQIWTDVDGMLTADPRIVPHARLVPELSFTEAAELAYFGAKVLHPSTIAPAVTRNIPVRILNSHRPEIAGSRIMAASRTPSSALTAIACKRDVTVIDILSSRMLMAHGFLRRIFEVFDRYQVPVDVVTTSEVSVSVTIDENRHLQDIVSALSEFAEVTSEPNMALICGVGERLRTEPSLCGRVMGALEGVPLRMVSQAGARGNISFVLPMDGLAAAMARLHDRFCVPEGLAPAPEHREQDTFRELAGERRG